MLLADTSKSPCIAGWCMLAVLSCCLHITMCGRSPSLVSTLTVSSMAKLRLHTAKHGSMATPAASGTGVISPQRAQRTFWAPYTPEADHRPMHMVGAKDTATFPDLPEGKAARLCSLHIQYCSEALLQIKLRLLRQLH